MTSTDHDTTRPTSTEAGGRGLRVLPVPPAVADAEGVKAVVRDEFGSLDEVGLPGPVYTRAQARAEHTLQLAIRDAYDDGVTVPCLADPATWDADNAPTTEEITRAAGLCRTACPAFAACSAFVATAPPVCGIVAGRFIPHPVDVTEHRAAAHAHKDDIACRAGATAA